MQFIQVLVESLRVKLKCAELWRKRKRRSYLEQPVAPAVEGGDDGGVDVAAIQTLEENKTREDIRLEYSTDTRLTVV